MAVPFRSVYCSAEYYYVTPYVLHRTVLYTAALRSSTPIVLSYKRFNFCPLLAQARILLYTYQRSPNSVGHSISFQNSTSFVQVVRSLFKFLFLSVCIFLGPLTPDPFCSGTGTELIRDRRVSLSLLISLALSLVEESDLI
jgi:hypothetical protein